MTNKGDKLTDQSYHTIVTETFAILTGRFSRCFNPRKRRPLKVKIHADILARCPDLDPCYLRVTLAAYTNNLGYLRAMQVGATRVDLDGNPAGEVTSTDSEHAKAKLAAKEKVKQRKATPQPEPKPEPKPRGDGLAALKRAGQRRREAVAA
jgi:ProP effector